MFVDFSSGLFFLSSGLLHFTAILILKMKKILQDIFDNLKNIVIYGFYNNTKGNIMNNNAYEKNPFILQNGIEIEKKDKRRTIARGEKFESPKGERYERVIHSIQEVDKEKFVKLFISKIRVLFDLSLTGNKLFYIFLFSISDAIGKDQVYMNFETAKDIASQCNFNLSNPVFLSWNKRAYRQADHSAKQI